MSWPAHGPSHHRDGALDRRDDALYRTRRIMVVVAGGAVTASVALGVVFASELPGHAAPQPAAGSPSGTVGSPSQAGAGPQSAPSASQSTAGQAQTAPSSAPPAPAPAPPQVVSGGS